MVTGFPPAVRRLAGLAVVALALVAFSSLPVARASADLPAWSAGDSWTYLGQGFPAPIGSGTVKYVVMGADTVLDNGTEVSAYHVEIWTNATGDAPVRAADEWYRTSDLAVVRLRLNLTQCSTGLLSRCSNSTVTDTMDPLPLRFPLTPGDAWTAATTVTTEIANQDSGVADWFNESGGTEDSVGADMLVSMPAGNFTATPLTEYVSGNAVVLSFSYATDIVRDYSSQVGNAVDERDYTPNPAAGGALVRSGELRLVAYAYTPPWYDLKALGLPLWSWLLVAAAAVPVGAVVLVRRRRGKAVTPPSRPGGSPQTPPPGPP